MLIIKALAEAYIVIPKWNLLHPVKNFSPTDVTLLGTSKRLDNDEQLNKKPSLIVFTELGIIISLSKDEQPLKKYSLEAIIASS